MNQPEDVEIVLSRDRRYKFHASVLARNSTLFADMLTSKNAAKLSSRARAAGVNIRWMIELQGLPSGMNPAGCFGLVELTPNGERADNRDGGIFSLNGRGSEAEQAYKDYEQIFYAFYNKSMTIAEDDTFEHALDDALRLLQISEYLGCNTLISKPIEVALLKHGQNLYKNIALKPQLWVEIAYRIRSELIFKECFIHLNGNWRVLKTNKQAFEHIVKLPGLRALIEKYHAKLIEKGKSLEAKLIGVYPGKIATPADDPIIRRESYARDILIWMALTFWRHYVTQRLVLDKGRHAPDCGYELYSQIQEGGDAYMDRPILQQFHDRFPMTKKGMTVLSNHLNEIKDVMKGHVAASKILLSNAQLDISQNPVTYLTCTDLDKEDYLWLKNESPDKATPLKRRYQPGGNDIARQNLDRARNLQKRVTVTPEDMGEGWEQDSVDDYDDDHQSKHARYE